jgi:hypothetical protein
MVLNTMSQRTGGKTITIARALGKKRTDVASKPPENRYEQGRGSDTVSIVIAENGDLLTSMQSVMYSCDCVGHTGQQKRIRELA